MAERFNGLRRICRQAKPSSYRTPGDPGWAEGATSAELLEFGSERLVGHSEAIQVDA